MMIYKHFYPKPWWNQELHKTLRRKEKMLSKSGSKGNHLRIGQGGRECEHTTEER